MDEVRPRLDERIAFWALRKAVAAIVAASFMMIGLGATSAVAAEPDASDSVVENGTTYGPNEDVGAVRVIDRTFESMPIPATAAKTLQSTGVTPYVATEYARSRHSHGISSGCAQTASVNGILSSFAWPWWYQRSFVTVKVNPGATVSWSTTRACQNSGSTTWHSENAIGSSVTALSPDVNLACNPG
ncbi:hypothetical protein [Agromyces laixinhei]|uniref:hypothetical protein n=1 Tax=Agromyces laixinhei TaxID=2585717 RepID=UPI001116481E|nr:hypothetical protein [Agromyces laixinhei]